MILAAIDPGSVNAGIAVFDDSQPVVVDELRTVDSMIDGGALYRVLRDMRVDEVVVEKAQAMPKQGVASTFRYGTAYGVILGVTSALRLPVILVSPASWKRHFSLDSDKEKSRALAIRLYPEVGEKLELKKHSHRAEALLMGRWRQETR